MNGDQYLVGLVVFLLAALATRGLLGSLIGRRADRWMVVYVGVLAVLAVIDFPSALTLQGLINAPLVFYFAFSKLTGGDQRKKN